MSNCRYFRIEPYKNTAFIAHDGFSYCRVELFEDSTWRGICHDHMPNPKIYDTKCRGTYKEYYEDENNCLFFKSDSEVVISNDSFGFRLGNLSYYEELSKESECVEIRLLEELDKKSFYDRIVSLKYMKELVD